MKRLILTLACALIVVPCYAAAPTVRSGTFDVGNATVGSITETEPASCGNGDALIALTDTQPGTPVESITSPTGWTDLYSGSLQNTGGACGGASDCVTWKVSWIARGASAPSLTWTTSCGACGGAGYLEVFLLCITGTDNSALDATSAAGASGNSVHNPDPPAVTAVSTTALVIAGAVTWDAALTPGYTASTGYTIPSGGTAAGWGGVLESKALSASGSENPGAFANTSTAGVEHMYWDGFSVTFKPTAAAPSCAPTMTLLGVGRCG